MQTVWTLLEPRLRIPVLLLSLLLFLLAGRITSHPPGHVAVERLFAFELALGSAASRAVVAGWSAAQRAAARASLGYDFGFIVCYVCLGALAASALAAAIQPGHPRLAWTGERLAWGFIAAGVLDCIENAGLLAALSRDCAFPWPQVAGVASITKWAYVATAVAYAIAAGTMALVGLRTAR
jgi:hypothetical protein